MGNEMGQVLRTWTNDQVSRRTALQSLFAFGGALSVGAVTAARATADHLPGHEVKAATDSEGWKLAPETTLSLSFFDAVPLYNFRPTYLGPDTYTATTYDPDGHFYYANYVAPPFWRLGLVADRSLYVNMLNLSSAIPRLRALDTSIIGMNQVLDQGEIGGEVDPPLSPPLPPESLVEYEWRVVAESGDFDETIVNPRSSTSPWLAKFELPHQGYYRLTCTVRFSDRPDETTIQRYLLRDFLMAGIGDSFASGEGNPDVAGDAANFARECKPSTLAMQLEVDIDMETDPIWFEPLAHRSLNSAHARAATNLQRMYELSDGTVVDDRMTFISLARSGATIPVGLLGPQEGDDDFIGLGQVDELVETIVGRTVDALMISIGGNDIGFAGSLKRLVSGDFLTFWPGLGNDADARDQVVKQVLKALEEDELLARAFRALDRRIRDLQDDGLVKDVYITTYPTTLFDTTEEDGSIGFDACGVFSGPELDINLADYNAILNVGQHLNRRIHDVAEEFGWNVVDVDSNGAFVGHGYCAEPTYWVFAERSCDWQGDFDGMMHPNIVGLNRIASLLTDRIQEVTIAGRPFA